jgi:hypothetical protein
LERLKLVIAFTISSIYLCTSQHKPFNPLLGETLQGKFEDGTRFYCEHTSHHPPITNFLVEDPNGLYTLSGYYEIHGKMGGNHLISGLRGPNNLTFKDGQRIRFGFPSYKLGGTVMGERTIETIGSCTFEDLTNNRKAVLLMSSFKKSGWIRQQSSGSKDSVEGLIYDSLPLSGDKKSVEKNYGKNVEFVTDLKRLKDVKQPICRVEGSWLRSLVIDGKKYWDSDTDVPLRQLPLLEAQPDHVLASDWRFREDLIWLQYGFQAIAQKWKIRLEVQQRADRANRQKSDKRHGRAKH